MESDLTPPPVEGPKIVPIRQELAAELAIELARDDISRRCAGHHKDVVVDDVERTVVCKACGYRLDPFDYLLAWAVDGSNRLAGLKAIEIKRRAAALQLDDLDRQIKNVRSRLKTAGKPQDPAKRQTYDRMGWNPRHADRIAMELPNVLYGRVPLNRDSVDARLFTDWQELCQHGPGAFLWDIQKGRRFLVMILPGQADPRSIEVVHGAAPGNHVWGWDGNLEQPTVTPSIDALELDGKGNRIGSLWHGFLTAGRFVSC